MKLGSGSLYEDVGSLAKFHHRQIPSRASKHLSGQCTVQTMHGSNERTTCCTASGSFPDSAVYRQCRSRGPGVRTGPGVKVPGGWRNYLQLIDAAVFHAPSGPDRLLRRSSSRPAPDRAAAVTERLLRLQFPAPCLHRQQYPRNRFISLATTRFATLLPEVPTRSRIGGCRSTIWRAIAPTSTTSLTNLGALHQV